MVLPPSTQGGRKGTLTLWPGRGQPTAPGPHGSLPDSFLDHTAGVSTLPGPRGSRGTPGALVVGWTTWPVAEGRAQLRLPRGHQRTDVRSPGRAARAVGPAL